MKRQIFALAVAFLGGVLIGLCLSRPAVVHAQNFRHVYVKRLDANSYSYQTVEGSTLGFSCVQNGSGTAECYALSGRD
ncbi:MAG: hypothetical protein ABSH28_24630 [Acidobacteriota bacterium]|jgi:hypothetical protein